MLEKPVEQEANLPSIPSFKVADDILYRQVEDEAVLLHIPTGMYYSLNEMGVRFWEALQQQPPAPVVEQIVAEYQVEYSQVHQDLLNFLKDLADYGVISWSSE